MPVVDASAPADGGRARGSLRGPPGKRGICRRRGLGSFLGPVAVLGLVLLPFPSGRCATTPVTTNRGLGGILAWGLNENAQLQVGDGVTNVTADQLVPTEIHNFPLSPATNAKVVVIDAAAGRSHTLIATDDGDVYGVGANNHGQLGVGDVFDRPRFTLVASFRDPPGSKRDGVNFEPAMGKQNVMTVAAAHDQSAAITDGGKLWMWGADTWGQLGLGCAPLAPSALFEPADDLTNFLEPRFIRGGGARQLPSSGERSARYVRSDTLIQCRSFGHVSEPALVAGMASTYTDKVVLARTFTAALTGMCAADKFADGACLPALTGATKVPVLGSVTARADATGAQLFLAEQGVETCTCGQVWMWGSNEHGQLGQGDNAYRPKPALVSSLADLGIHISDIALGEYHAVALSSNGVVYTWGYNANGQLGTTDTVSRPLPTRVRKAEAGFLYVSAVAAGLYHSVMVADRGDMYAFGSNRDGQLGLGQEDKRPHPVPTAMQAPRLPGAAVTCGAYHCLALTPDLVFYHWGWNAFGQLGDGSTRNVVAPRELRLPSHIPGFPIIVAAGHAHSLVVLQTGDLTFCGVSRWGRNACTQRPELPAFLTTDSGGVWWVVGKTTKGLITVAGNEALEFEASGNIQLYRNESNLGVFPYSAVFPAPVPPLVANQEGYTFQFTSVDLAFDTLDLEPDAVWSTDLLV